MNVEHGERALVGLKAMLAAGVAAEEALERLDDREFKEMFGYIAQALRVLSATIEFALARRRAL